MQARVGWTEWRWLKEKNWNRFKKLNLGKYWALKRQTNCCNDRNILCTNLWNLPEILIFEKSIFQNARVTTEQLGFVGYRIAASGRKIAISGQNDVLIATINDEGELIEKYSIKVRAFHSNNIRRSTNHREIEFWTVFCETYLKRFNLSMIPKASFLQRKEWILFFFITIPIVNCSLLKNVD